MQSDGGLDHLPFLPFCPAIALDPLGHHGVTCRHGGGGGGGGGRYGAVVVELLRIGPKRFRTRGIIVD